MIYEYRFRPASTGLLRMVNSCSSIRVCRIKCRRSASRAYGVCLCREFSHFEVLSSRLSFAQARTVLAGKQYYSSIRSVNRTTSTRKSQRTLESRVLYSCGALHQDGRLELAASLEANNSQFLARFLCLT
jgi:hypothetical protein